MSEFKKDTDNGLIFGVCSGLAKWIGTETSIVRVVFALAAVFGLGSPILIYLILAIFMPSGD